MPNAAPPLRRDASQTSGFVRGLTSARQARTPDSVPSSNKNPSLSDGQVMRRPDNGCTGSGKTFSMSGIEELLAVARKKSLDLPASARSPRDEVELSDGIIPRALKYLYHLFESAPKDVKFVVRASYCEIYNEQVFDLLNSASGSLSVRWNDRNGFYVQNLLVVQCDSMDDLMAVVHEGHRNRRVGTHDMNKDSSRRS
ncbi:hypothetical protein Poli38472_004489 [Pythium oligandrum]|uniref:Kinesin motor domain-containing protein n=1 Tax=Pythium oligandrum TaxID=41045 RepID=A0A8K1CAV5_PYTOL|nr:hypothetical protein Poli38472_004489 [Pythium oligandrum]|eukprot:TMW59420.1 hypothetical protein Poli38472_004489 [Pythium oligandrum]